MKKSLFKAVSVVLSAVLIMAAFTACGKKNAGKFTTDKIVMTYVTAPLNVPSIVEKEEETYKKAFEELGLGFEYSEITSGADQTAALASGDIHILNAVGASSVLLAAANDSDIVILSMYSRAPKAFALFSNDEGIDSPEKLKGLTVAGPKGTILHELLAAYLAQAGMTTDDVNFVNMDIPSAIAALDGGSVDVALAGGAAAYNCENAGIHKITDGEGLISAAVCTAASRKFADDNPEIIDKFLETQKKISDEINADEGKAIEITAKSLDMDPAAVKDQYVLYDFNQEISGEDVRELEATENFLYDNGMIESHVDCASLIYR